MAGGPVTHGLRSSHLDLPNSRPLVPCISQFCELEVAPDRGHSAPIFCLLPSILSKCVGLSVGAEASVYVYSKKCGQVGVNRQSVQRRYSHLFTDTASVRGIDTR